MGLLMIAMFTLGIWTNWTSVFTAFTNHLLRESWNGSALWARSGQQFSLYLSRDWKLRRCLFDRSVDCQTSRGRAGEVVHSESDRNSINPNSHVCRLPFCSHWQTPRHDLAQRRSRLGNTGKLRISVHRYVVDCESYVASCDPHPRYAGVGISLSSSNLAQINTANHVAIFNPNPSWHWRLHGNALLWTCNVGGESSFR